MSSLRTKKNRLLPIPFHPNSKFFNYLPPRNSAAQSNGAIQRGVGVVNSSRTGTGEYDVTFASDISECVALVTIGKDGTSLIPAFASASVAFADNNDLVRVRIYRDTGLEFDRDFYIALFC